VLACFAVFFSLLGAVPAISKNFVADQIALDVRSGGESDDKLILASVSLSPNTPPILRIHKLSTPDIKQASVKASPDYPQPSVILGFIVPGQEALYDLIRLLPATVDKIKFSLDDLDAREALRNNDPDMFRRLIEEGHIDPDQSQLGQVLQTEFKRMKCYRSSIDGQWGPGSRRAVGAYFDQLNNITWPDQSLTVILFRSVLINGDVDCPMPLKAKKQLRSVNAKKEVEPVTKKPKISLGGGSGVFR
tara:strand:+ start:13845 stop:14585 length:741 start_codon:yes stop_codon:yes gene_type:complete